MTVTVCYPFVGDSVGGSHLSALTLIRYLDRDRYRPVVVLHQEGPLESHVGDLGIPYEKLPLAGFVGREPTYARNAFRLVSAFTPLVGFLRSQGVDLVHGNDSATNLTWLSPARLAGARFVWHQRARVTPPRMMNRAAQWADCVIAISHFVEQGLRPTIRVRVIDNPFEFDRPSSPLRDRLLARFGRDDGTRMVTYAARLTLQKRPEIFLAAARRVAEQLSEPVVFLLLGRGSAIDRGRLGELTSDKGIADRVHFLGFQSPIEEYFAASDVVVVPAVEDAFGRTLIEAMAVGTPVVASRSGGHPEVIEDGVTGLLFPPDDVNALADQILHILRDQDLAERLSRAGMATVRARYSAEKHAQQVMAVYEDALRRSRSPVSRRRRRAQSNPP